MAVSIRINSNLPLVQRLFKAMRQMGADPQPLLRDIAFLGESSTRERFRSQSGPDGQRWKPSLRAQLFGGKTLTQDGHLGDSITSTADRTTAAWGTNRIYAAIHQFGGEIKAKGTAGLRFKIGERWATKRQVSIPARPFLGVSADDAQDILDLVSDYVSNLVRRSAPGGA
ncbi:phage virion morphogenesis protein [Pseudomonas sp. MBLB4136]|uniref:phage virion morphogenesis protein n=1 Tax=Pseudomonas sp. MBLB4136 TaxID=3451558 RepID=UPI003F754341